MSARSIGRVLSRLSFVLALLLAASATYPFTMNTSPVTPANASGLWWNTNESGWGINIDHQQTIIFATIFTYDASGYAHWYFASDCRVANDGCVGDLYRAGGGTPMTVPWNGSGLSLTKVGTLTLRFTDNNSGSMTYSIDGVTSSRTITRMQLAPPAPTAPSSYDKTAMLLGGTWTYVYTIISTFRDTYAFTSISSTPNSDGDFYAYGKDAYNGTVIGSYYSKGGFWSVLDTGTIIDMYYVFNFSDINHVSGCYYQISPPGSNNFSKCYAMTGSRYPLKSMSPKSDPLKLMREVAEDGGPQYVDPTVIEAYHAQRRMAQ